MNFYIIKFKGVVSEAVVFNSAEMCRTSVSKYLKLLEKVLKAI